MDSTKFFELLSYTIPAFVTGGVAIYFFLLHTKNENRRRNFLLRKEKHTASLPLRLQAYERMALFLERISPNSLVVRVTPTSNDKPAYFKKLLLTVEKEFEHNLAQQIYMTSECWDIIVKSKNATINIMKDTMLDGEIKSAKAMQEAILQEMIEKESPTSIALKYIKKEVSKIF